MQFQRFSPEPRHQSSRWILLSTELFTGGRPASSRCAETGKTSRALLSQLICFHSVSLTHTHKHTHTPILSLHLAKPLLPHDRRLCRPWPAPPQGPVWPEAHAVSEMWHWLPQMKDCWNKVKRSTTSSFVWEWRPRADKQMQLLRFDQRLNLLCL